MSKFITDLCNYAKTAYAVEQHSTDNSGGLGEDIPPFFLFCWEFENFKTVTPSTNTQQQANRIVNAVVQQSMLEPRSPLGKDATLRSQVGEENINNNSDRTHAANVMRDIASLVGIVENAGISSGATRLVTNGVASALTGLSTRRSRNDVISHIEKTRERQASHLCESLGALLNNIIHHPRSLADNAKKYREAERSLNDATSEASKAFRRSLCDKLSNKLNNMN